MLYTIDRNWFPHESDLSESRLILIKQILFLMRFKLQIKVKLACNYCPQIGNEASYELGQIRLPPYVT